MYEIRVSDPSSTEQNKALLKTVALNFLAMTVGRLEAPVPAKIEVHIVDRRTDRVVYARRDDPKEARQFESEITADLDRLDPAAFAKQWGIGVVAGPRPKLRLRNGVRKLLRRLGAVLRHKD